MRLEAVKRKVRALLATAAAGSGATDPERQTAQRLAERLMARYNLNPANVASADAVVARPVQQPPAPRPAPQAPIVVHVVVNGNSYGWSFDRVDTSNSTTASGFSW